VRLRCGLGCSQMQFDGGVWRRECHRLIRRGRTAESSLSDLLASVIPRRDCHRRDFSKNV
jgi:hypothetical protein